MKDRPIITSLLDLDWYKLTMLQWIWKYFPDLRVKMGFKNRTTSVPLAEFVEIGALIDQLEVVRKLKPSYEEVEYLRQQGIFREDFLTYFSNHSLPDYEVWTDRGQIHIEIDGRWSDVTLWETIVLSIINQMYYESLVVKNNLDLREIFSEGNKRLDEKIRILQMHPGIQFIEFGTRRRFSAHWQRYVALWLCRKVPSQILGTSNVLLAKQLGLKPVGTFAHELYMALYGRYYDENPPHYSTHQVLQLWYEMYGPSLSIALTDTYTSHHFLQCFERYAEDWRGLRHDSGPPIEFGERAIAFYEQLRLDPRGKTLVYSDGLDMEKIVQIHQYFSNRIMTTFGWGTNLTNDLGLAPLSLVMKIIESNDHPVVKLSDNPEKANGDPAEVERCKRLVSYNPNQHRTEKCTY